MLLRSNLILRPRPRSSVEPALQDVTFSLMSSRTPPPPWHKRPWGFSRNALWKPFCFSAARYCSFFRCRRKPDIGVCYWIILIFIIHVYIKTQQQAGCKSGRLYSCCPSYHCFFSFFSFIFRSLPWPLFICGYKPSFWRQSYPFVYVATWQRVLSV